MDCHAGHIRDHGRVGGESPGTLPYSPVLRADRHHHAGDLGSSACSLIGSAAPPSSATWTRGVAAPLGSVAIGAYSVSAYQLVLIAITFLVMAFCFLGLAKTRWGLIARGTMRYSSTWRRPSVFDPGQGLYGDLCRWGGSEAVWRGGALARSYVRSLSLYGRHMMSPEPSSRLSQRRERPHCGHGFRGRAVRPP